MTHPNAQAPMLCTPIPAADLDQLLRILEHRYDNDDDWVYQLKADGDRRLVRVIDGVVKPLNRSGEPTSLPMPMIRALAAQPFDFTIDGELVGTGAAKRLWLFDLPEAAGMVEPTTPYYQRLAGLATLHRGMALAAASIELLPTARTPAEKFPLRTELLARGNEGVVVKHISHPYLGGKRSGQSLKAKFVKQVDAHVTGLGVDGHDNIALTVYRPDGSPVEVGEVTAQAGDGAKIKALFLAGRRDLVVTVKVLNATPDDRLYQPTFPKLRTDKSAAQCHLDQLDAIRANKTVLVPEWAHG